MLVDDETRDNSFDMEVDWIRVSHPWYSVLLGLNCILKPGVLAQHIMHTALTKLAGSRSAERTPASSQMFASFSLR